MLYYTLITLAVLSLIAIIFLVRRNLKNVARVFYSEKSGVTLEKNNEKPKSYTFLATSWQFVFSNIFSILIGFLFTPLLSKPFCSLNSATGTIECQLINFPNLSDVKVSVQNEEIPQIDKDGKFKVTATVYRIKTDICKSCNEGVYLTITYNGKAAFYELPPLSTEKQNGIDIKYTDLTFTKL